MLHITFVLFLLQIFLLAAMSGCHISIEFFHAEIAYGQTSLRIVSIIYHYIKNLRVTIANDLSLFLFSHACVNCPRDFRLAMGCAEPQAGQVSTGTCEKLTCIATKHQNPINIIRMVPFN